MLPAPSNARGVFRGERRELIAWAALLTAVSASRLMAAQGILYDWDAANYALSLVDFNVYEHQPHPPGSPLFWLLLKLFSWLPGPTAPFLVVNTCFTAAILVILGKLAQERARGLSGLLFAAGFAAAPQFWHHGATTTAYVAECFCSVAVAMLAWRLLNGQLRHWKAGLLFAIVTGLRPNTLVTLGPLFLFSVAAARPSKKQVFEVLLASSLGCLAWLIPTVLASGGLARYRQASSALGGWQLDVGSIFGGETGHILPQTRELTTYLLDGANLILVALLVNIAVGLFRRRVHVRRLLFLVLWFAPGAVLYMVHHLPKSGYTLTLLPVLFVAVAWSLGPQPARGQLRFTQVMLVLFIALNGLCFLYAVPAELNRYRDARIDISEPVVVTGDYGLMALRYRTYPQRQVLKILDRLGDDDLALFLFGTHELHRMASYYRPKKWMIATSLDHRSALSSRADRCVTSFGDFQGVVLTTPTSRTWSQATRVGWDGGLRLERRGKHFSVELGKRPERMVVFYPCKPCRILTGEGVSRLGQPHVGALYRAAVLKVAGPR